MIVKLLTDHHLEFLSLTVGCRGSSESTHVKMPHCWKSHAAAHIVCHQCGKKYKLITSLRNHEETTACKTETQLKKKKVAKVKIRY